MKTSLSPANKNDAELLTAIQVEAFSEQVKKYNFAPPGYDSIDFQIKSMKRYFYYKILHEDEIVGGIIVNRIAKNTCYILRIFIKRQRQNSGTGTQAMQLLENEFPKIRKWQLDTPYLSFQNHHFYEKLGYRKIGETKPESNGFYCFLYEKET
ncbi:MAG: GNAT family N-acetyltransferase [Chloroflexi bacterium]|nr:GNAT family N-acetyltransferase [Chloroflexota bacterium]